MQRYRGFFGRDRLMTAGIPLGVILALHLLVMGLSVFVQARITLDEALLSLLGALPVYGLVGFIILVQQQRRAEMDGPVQESRADA